MIMKPFDFINQINFGKQDIMTGTDNDELAESIYSPFLTNRSLSYFPDTILYSNEMNINHHIDNKLQYHFLINTIRPRKRFSKWAKKDNSEDFELVKQYFNYNDSKTVEALSILTDEQINIIKKRLIKGG